MSDDEEGDRFADENSHKQESTEQDTKEQEKKNEEIDNRTNINDMDNPYPKFDDSPQNEQSSNNPNQIGQEKGLSYGNSYSNLKNKDYNIDNNNYLSNNNNNNKVLSGQINSNPFQNDSQNYINNNNININI